MCAIRYSEKLKFLICWMWIDMRCGYGNVPSFCGFRRRATQPPFVSITTISQYIAVVGCICCCCHCKPLPPTKYMCVCVCVRSTRDDASSVLRIRNLMFGLPQFILWFGIVYAAYFVQHPIIASQLAANTTMLRFYEVKWFHNVLLCCRCRHQYHFSVFFFLFNYSAIVATV